MKKPQGERESGIPIVYLRDRLTYDPESGEVCWVSRPEADFATPGAWRSWNSRMAGKVAGSDSSSGYRDIRVDGTRLMLHRVIWAMYHGHWPKGQIDHINGSRADNRIQNLRDVSVVENRRNAAIPSDNKSGVAGVRWKKRDQRWVAEVGVGGRRVHLGNFESFQEAVDCRKAAEVEYRFHRNHGRTND